MRCSSCEPLLDAYLEASLSRRQGAEVIGHLQACDACAGLLRELRVIDGLLTTARPPGVASDFTASVVTAARVAPPYAGRRTPLWIPLLAYLTIAWALTALVWLRSNAVANLVANIGLSEQRSLAALDAAVRALAPATPLAAAAVTLVLLLDLVLLGGIVYGYRRVHSLVLLYLTRGTRP
jgi:predicted anti-sigma-YlaC factor YlaD